MAKLQKLHPEVAIYTFLQGYHVVRRSNWFWAGLSLIQQDAPGPSEDDGVYVIDGGSLLHRIPWQKGTAFVRSMLTM